MDQEKREEALEKIRGSSLTNKTYIANTNAVKLSTQMREEFSRGNINEAVRYAKTIADIYAFAPNQGAGVEAKTWRYASVGYGTENIQENLKTLAVSI